MTKVVALQNIPGLKAGKIGDLNPQRQKHVDAGNAAILPGEHDAWEGEPIPAPADPITFHTTGSSDDEPVGDMDVDAAYETDDDSDDDEATTD